MAKKQEQPIFRLLFLQFFNIWSSTQNLLPSSITITLERQPFKPRLLNQALALRPVDVNSEHEYQHKTLYQTFT